MTAVNKILLLSFAVVLGAHTLLSRGLDHDGAFKLMTIAIYNTFFYNESARIISNTLSQLPVWLFVKLSSSSSLSFLTILYSFSLIWIHIISIVGCFLILPKEKKRILFFPLFAFLTGPLPALDVSVSMALSICSYVWLTAFIIYYSDLSFWKYRLFFALVPFPLLLSHELISYMAFPLIALCILKYKKESGFLNKMLIAGVVGVLAFSSLLAFWFLFIAKVNIGNKTGFLDTLTSFIFIYSNKGFNLPVIISICLILFLGLYAIPFKEKNSAFKGKEKRDTLKKPLIVFLSQFLMKIWINGKGKAPLFLFILVSTFSGLMIFPLVFSGNILDVSEFETRVWPPCFALPLGLSLWWFLKEKELCFKNQRWFFISLVIASVALTLWRVKSDWEFYKHQKEFSEVLSTFQGVVEWPDVEKAFQDVSLKEKIGWTMTAASLLYPRSRTVKAILIESYPFCKKECEKWNTGPASCDTMCRHKAFGLYEKEFEYFSNSRFFDFSLLNPGTD